MRELYNVPTEWTRSVLLRDVYPNWLGRENGDSIDVKSFIHSVLAAGVKPKRIEVHNLEFVIFVFETFMEWNEFELAIRKVLDLLWLVE